MSHTDKEISHKWECINYGVLINHGLKSQTLTLCIYVCLHYKNSMKRCWNDEQTWSLLWCQHDCWLYWYCKWHKSKLSL